MNYFCRGKSFKIIIKLKQFDHIVNSYEIPNFAPISRKFQSKINKHWT